MEGTEEPISRPGRCHSEVCVKPSLMEIAVVRVERHARILATRSFMLLLFTNTERKHAICHVLASCRRCSPFKLMLCSTP